MSKKTCPRTFGHYKGSVLSGDRCHVKHIRNRIECNSWSCPVCNPRKVKNLRRRILKGKISNYDNSRPGYRSSKHDVKMFTFTCPGKEFRKQYSPAEALDSMNGNLNRMITAFKKSYGRDFEYFKVVEPQRDGYPHFHIVMVGPAIAPRSVYWYFRNLWQNHYSMGIVDVQWRETKSVKHAVMYLTKYLTKCQKPIKKHSRLFTSSRGALEKAPEKPFWIQKTVYPGELGLPPKTSITYIPRCDIAHHVWEALSPKLKLQIFPQLFSLSDFCLYPDTVPF